MKSTNPIFLQAASRRVTEPLGKVYMINEGNFTPISSISCNGDLRVSYTRGGQKVVDTYTDLEGESLYIFADPNTSIVLMGDMYDTLVFEEEYHALKTLRLVNTGIENLDCSNAFRLQTLDVSKNTALTRLDCYYCAGLTALDLSANTALNSLNCATLDSIEEIKYLAAKSNAASKMAAAINGYSTTGTMHLHTGASYNSTVESACQTKGWSVVYDI